MFRIVRGGFISNNTRAVVRSSVWLMLCKKIPRMPAGAYAQPETLTESRVIFAC